MSLWSSSQSQEKCRATFFLIHCWRTCRYLEPHAEQPGVYAEAKLDDDDDGAYAPVTDTADQDTLSGFAAGAQPAQAECVIAVPPPVVDRRVFACTR